MTTQYAYSGDGVRLAQTVAGEVTRYVVDRAVPLPQVLAENRAGTQTAYLHGLGMVAQYDSGRWAYQHPDGLGSVRQLTNAAGQVTLARNYDPFGVPLAQSGTAPGSFGYAGEQHDPASGLIFLRARYYDPSTGRFLTRDPYPAYATVPSTLHRYAYAGNNPVNQVDPSGLQAVPQSRVPSSSLAQWRALRERLAWGTGGRIGSPSRAGRLSYTPGWSFSWPSFSYNWAAKRGRGWSSFGSRSPYDQTQVAADRARAVDGMNDYTRAQSRGLRPPQCGPTGALGNLMGWLDSPEAGILAVGASIAILATSAGVSVLAYGPAAAVPVLVGIGAGAASGAMGLFVQDMANVARGGEWSSWQAYARYAGIGALSGGVAALVGMAGATFGLPPAVTGAISGFVVGSLTQATLNAFDPGVPWYRGVMQTGLTGAIGGAVGGAIAGGLLSPTAGLGERMAVGGVVSGLVSGGTHVAMNVAAGRPDPWEGLGTAIAVGMTVGAVDAAADFYAYRWLNQRQLRQRPVRSLAEDADVESSRPGFWERAWRLLADETGGFRLEAADDAEPTSPLRLTEWDPRAKQLRATADFEFKGKLYKKGDVVPGEAIEAYIKYLGPGDPQRRVVKPIEGLYESIPTDLSDVLPPGWRIVSEDPISLKDPHFRFIETKVEFVDPETGEVARGVFQRIYRPEEKKLVLMAAFLQDPNVPGAHRLPGWIEAGKPLVPGRGTPTATFFTLYQMRKLGVPFGGLERVMWSDVVNQRTLLHLEWLKGKYPNTPVEDLISHTHSVTYAEAPLIHWTLAIFDKQDGLTEYPVVR